MTPYEQYLLSEYKPPTIENNPVSIFGKSAVIPDWNMDSQIQGELANKPAYNSNGQRYGSTLSDDMIDIKNNRRGNPETSNHPWVGGYNDYDNFTNAEPKIPVLEKIDYTPCQGVYPAAVLQPPGLFPPSQSIIHAKVARVSV